MKKYNIVNLGDKMELRNCANCGAVYAHDVVDLCPQCYRAEEDAFNTVYKFLQKRKNREATIKQIVEATEVNEDVIIKFLKQNRLRASQFPSLTYPCEHCGAEIVEGKLCAPCSKKILTEWSAASDEVEEKTDEEVNSVYYTMNKKWKD